MIKKHCTIIGIEVRHSSDPQSKVKLPDRYYIHATHYDADLLDGLSTFSGKVDEVLASNIQVGDVVNIVYRSFNGYNTVEDVYR